MNKHLSNFLSANSLISPFQSGFRCGDSAPLHVFRLTTELFAALDSRVFAAAVFYDFKKAFDSVWHRALIESSSLLECPVQPLNGYQTLLLTVHNTSKWATLFLPLALQRLVFLKVPLSALHLLFFSLILLRLARSVQQTDLQMIPAQSHLACHSSPLNKRSSLASQLQPPGQEIRSSLSIQKTVCMLFHHPRHHPPDLHILLNNRAITQVHQHKHIGVILSSTLSWSPHVDHLISRSSAMLGLLRHLHSYFQFSSRCLLTVYLCYIRPLLE